MTSLIAFAPDWLCTCGHTKDNHPQRVSGFAGTCDECRCPSFRSRADYPHGDTICAGCHSCQPERFSNRSAAFCGCEVCRV